MPIEHWSACSSAVFILSAMANAGALASEPTFSVDIVADCNRFITEGTGHLDPELNPQFGDFFMQEGLIYEGGTFEANCPETRDCGLAADGTPEFPEQVIGKWTCYGSFVGQGIDTPEGTWLYSTQIYEFDVEELADDVFEAGRNLLVSHGPERIDLDVPFLRAITGGTGRFQRSTGQVEQTKIGFNATTCENLTFAFDLRPDRQP
jgi:hypothetical protein